MLNAVLSVLYSLQLLYIAVRGSDVDSQARTTGGKRNVADIRVWAVLQ